MGPCVAHMDSGHGARCDTLIFHVSDIIHDHWLANRSLLLPLEVSGAIHLPYASSRRLAAPEVPRSSKS